MNHRLLAIALSPCLLVVFAYSRAFSQCQTCTPPAACTNYTVTIKTPAANATLTGGGTTKVCGCVNWFKTLPDGCSKGTSVTVIIQNQTTCAYEGTSTTLPGTCAGCSCNGDDSEYCTTKASIPAGTSGTKGLIIANYYLASSLAACTTQKFTFQ